MGCIEEGVAVDCVCCIAHRDVVAYMIVGTDRFGELSRTVSLAGAIASYVYCRDGCSTILRGPMAQRGIMASVIHTLYRRE